MKIHSDNLALHGIVAFLLLVLSFSCTDATQPAGTLSGEVDKKYFDLKGYMEGEKERLARMKGFSKTVYVNGKQETLKPDQINFDEELEIFADADINRPAWSDKYEIDSTFNSSGSLVKLSYTSNDKKLLTQSLVVSYDQGQVDKIEIEKGSVTSVADTQQSLVYEPAVGYSIESRQDVVLVDKIVFRIEVFFDQAELR